MMFMAKQAKERKDMKEKHADEAPHAKEESAAGEDIQTLVKIKEAEAAQESKLADAQIEAQKMLDKAKNEAAKIEDVAKTKAEDDYYAIVAAAEQEAIMKRENILKSAKNRASAIKGVDKGTSMKLFKKLLTDKFGV